MTFHPVDENRDRDEPSGFKRADQLRDIGLVGDDVFAVEKDGDAGQAGG